MQTELVSSDSENTDTLECYLLGLDENDPELNPIKSSKKCIELAAPSNHVII